MSISEYAGGYTWEFAEELVKAFEAELLQDPVYFDVMAAEVKRRRLNEEGDVGDAAVDAMIESCLLYTSDAADE